MLERLSQRCGLRPTQGPLGTWTERATAAVQLQDIALGFRLQLHAQHEYRMLYWWAGSTMLCPLRPCPG